MKNELFFCVATVKKIVRQRGRCFAVEKEGCSCAATTKKTARRLQLCMTRGICSAVTGKWMWVKEGECFLTLRQRRKLHGGFLLRGAVSKTFAAGGEWCNGRLHLRHWRRQNCMSVSVARRRARRFSSVGKMNANKRLEFRPRPNGARIARRLHLHASVWNPPRCGWGMPVDKGRGMFSYAAATKKTARRFFVACGE